MSLDFEEVVDNNKPEGDAIKRLEAIVSEAEEAESNVEQLEELLKSAKARLHQIKTNDIPKLLSELQTTEWLNAKTGTKVKVTSFVSGSLPKEPEKNEAAVKYLESLEGGKDLFKTTVYAEFGRHCHNEALALADDIRKSGYTPIVESGVHAATLQAYVRERSAAGDNIDIDKLGIFMGRTTKITKKRIKPGSDKK